ncbi:hypothetical protein GCM10009681_25440 [Luedemannella helvata]|uniref:Uncharacterized protein n=1 Tax=Luedemannella helvata TaxID=349315 RepID=A0ABN2KD12_9ACTN
MFGAGLSGLMAAIKIREACPRLRVVIIEKPAPESNTQISGMRIRAGVGHRRDRPAAEEVCRVLADRNDGVCTPQMRVFADVLVGQLDHWQRRRDFIGQVDRAEWFGPQWGRPNRAGHGRGRSVLAWLRGAATAVGAEFVRGELRRLDIDGDRVTGALTVLDRSAPEMLRAAAYVLASGSATGLLFSSTNKRIHFSAHEVAFHSGLPLVGSTLHMLHPFGNSGADGRPRVGCLETDLLAGHVVHGATGPDEWASALLARHLAHDHLSELARRLSEQPQPLRLVDAAGHVTHARISQHYHHLGVLTDDGVQVAGLSNAFAVGDASGIGYWTGYRERHPGFALAKCLVDAELLARSLAGMALADATGPAAAAPHRLVDPRPSAEDLADIAAVNTTHLFALLRTADGHARERAARAWVGAAHEVVRRTGASTLALLGFGVAQAHARAAAGASEPIPVSRDLALGDAVAIGSEPASTATLQGGAA